MLDRMLKKWRGAPQRESEIDEVIKRARAEFPGTKFVKSHGPTGWYVSIPLSEPWSRAQDDRLQEILDECA